MPFISVTGLNKFYAVAGKRLHVLRDLDLSVEKGEMVAIMGASGVGKSTLLHVLGGLDRIDGGDVRVGEHDITTEWGYAFALRLLDHVRSRIVVFQEETGHMYNLEATPAEGTTYRFAKEDLKRYPGILQAGTPERPYYTNSSQLPVGYTDDPFEALERQEALQRKYTGGTVLHLYMSERLSSTEACRTLVKRALERFALPYITVTPTFSICPHHGYLAGEHTYCPKCDEERLAQKRQEHLAAA